MVDANVLASKLRELSERVARVRSNCLPEASLLAKDQDRLELVSFNLMLAIQACLDIASHVISDEGWASTETLAGAFLRLQEQGVLTAKTAAALAEAAKFRNLVAHGYAETDPVLIHEAAIHGPADLERFASEVSAWASSRLQG